MLKLKDFKEEEVTIIDVIDGKGREKETAIFMVKDIRGNQFPIRPNGSFEKRREWFQHPETCRNRLYTIRFQEETKNGIPRFPTGKGFRDSKSNPGVKVY